MPRMYPIKGAAGQRPFWPRMHSKAKDNRPLWVIGVDAGKEALYARLKITEAGPGFCHFPISDQYDLGYFENDHVCDGAARRDLVRRQAPHLRPQRANALAGAGRPDRRAHCGIRMSGRPRVR